MDKIMDKLNSYKELNNLVNSDPKRFYYVINDVFTLLVLVFPSILDK